MKTLQAKMQLKKPKNNSSDLIFKICYKYESRIGK